MSARTATWLTLAIVTVAACGGSTPSTPTSSDTSPIKIGMIVNLTGAYATLGGYDKKAALQIVDEYNNKGGINGRKIQLDIEDDATVANNTVIAYNKLADDGHVAIVGPAFSNNELAILPLTDSKKVPVVGVAASDATVEPVHPYYWMTAPRTTELAVNLLKYLKLQGYTSVTMAHDTKSAYADSGSGHMKDMASQYGITFNDEPFETTQTDFTPLIQHIKTQNPKAVLMWATGAPPVTFGKAYAASGLKLPLIMTAAEGTPLFYKPLGVAGEGITVQVTLGVVGDRVPAGNAAKKIIDPIAKTYSDANGGEYPPEFFWDSYVAFQLIFDAIKRKGATPAQIKAGLDSANLLTPQGDWKYTAKQHWGLPAPSVIMAEVKGGRFEPNSFGTDTLNGKRQ